MLLALCLWFHVQLYVHTWDCFIWQGWTLLKAGLSHVAGLLAHQDADVRRAALRVFQGSDSSGQEVLKFIPGIAEDIGQLLQDPEPKVRGVAALALCRLGSKASKPFAEQLIFMLQNPSADGAELRDVLAALASLGSSGDWAAEAVAGCLWLEHWSVRRAAAETYGQIVGPRSRCGSSV